MHITAGYHCSPISTAHQVTRPSKAAIFRHGSSCNRRLARRCRLTHAIDGKSNSHEETDTAPEGKGEQREQPANRTDGRKTWTQLRVERQTHLPASREEAWQALQSLLPQKEWKETSAVFASLEAIYRQALLLASQPASYILIERSSAHSLVMHSESTGAPPHASLFAQLLLILHGRVSYR